MRTGDPARSYSAGGTPPSVVPNDVDNPHDEVVLPGGGLSVATSSEEARGESMTRGLVWSTIGAVIIGWIPLAGPFAAGYAGGRVAQSRIRGIYSTFIAGIVCVLWGWVFNFMLPPIVPSIDALNRIVTGGSALVMSLLFIGQFIACVVGGWVGGALSERDPGRAPREWPRPA